MKIILIEKITFKFKYMKIKQNARIHKAIILITKLKKYKTS
jgi:hypothetical protein